MNKTEMIEKFRCTPLERRAVECVAQQEGLKLSEAARRLIREGSKALGVWPPDGDSSAAVAEVSSRQGVRDG